MPGYIEAALTRFHHICEKPEDQPHACAKPQYGAKIQLSEEPDDSPLLDKPRTKRIQQIVGVLLYYARAIDNTMLPALSSIASTQAQSTQSTENACHKLLSYAATHPDATIRFHASDMVLHIHTDGSYLSEPKAKSRAANYFYLSSHPDKVPIHDTPDNGALHVVATIIQPVMSSAAEAEVAAAFHGGKEGCPLRQTLIDLNHPQPATPITTDNECCHGILTDTVKQKRSKAFDMRFYWLQDRILEQNQYSIHWKPGAENKADYHSKHHPASHHRLVRPLVLHEPSLPHQPTLIEPLEV